ncbi:hypothetical protein AZC_3433 [Azorhizobium caulinodans ORS 571]|uniref:Uncharacterized protein n=1 Tax=Azorhizobium caulinodans (strain ATCC 43989 / DSM 5975 / JCM 20966 / LMG 6465 / NBRC 14845 / NCIMB 13405 / ORS 571) TaxID=438753 RepID=A8IIP6_AZOC5|nr:hypothetical protein [Azorhizobium]TDU01239.1 hypothetical protein DFO45_0756 [Azorhizobium sp. AG788]BAF89431.1 hypothetical protein AZC_3433 [Azorhizobium caulinodans ORS 571]
MREGETSAAATAWAARRLRTQLGLEALHEENVRANPLPYLERASEHIYQLERALFEAMAAAFAPQEGMSEVGPPEAGSITLSAADHARLIACRDRVARALSEVVAQRGG